MTSLTSGLLMPILYASVVIKIIHSVFSSPGTAKVMAIRDLSHFDIAK